MNTERRSFLAGTTAALLFSPSILRADGPRLRMATTDNFRPYSTYDPDKGWVGFEIDATHRLIEHHIPEIELEMVSKLGWVRSLASMKTGFIDLMTHLSYRQERAEFMDYIGVYNVERAFLVTREDQDVGDLAEIDDLTKVSNRPIGIQSSMSWDPEFDKRLRDDADFQKNFRQENGSIHSSDESQLALLRLVLRSRVGGWIMAEYNMRSMIERSAERLAKGNPGVMLKATRIKAFGEPVTYLAASRKTPLELRDYLRQTYKAARLDGSFDAIWSKWFESSEPPPAV